MQNFVTAMNVKIAERGLMKKAVAKRMNITDKKLSDILHGRSKISVEIIRSFCEAVGTTPNSLFEYKKQ